MAAVAAPLARLSADAEPCVSRHCTEDAPAGPQALSTTPQRVSWGAQMTGAAAHVRARPPAPPPRDRP
jgi:hypothetical protein